MNGFKEAWRAWGATPDEIQRRLGDIFGIETFSMLIRPDYIEVETFDLTYDQLKQRC